MVDRLGFYDSTALGLRYLSTFAQDKPLRQPWVPFSRRHGSLSTGLSTGLMLKVISPELYRGTGSQPLANQHGKSGIARKQTPNNPKKIIKHRIVVSVYTTNTLTVFFSPLQTSLEPLWADGRSVPKRETPPEFSGNLSMDHRCSADNLKSVLPTSASRVDFSLFMLQYDCVVIHMSRSPPPHDLPFSEPARLSLFL